MDGKIGSQAAGDSLRALESKLARSKRQTWMSATWCYVGAIRVHEILSRTPHS